MKAIVLALSLLAVCVSTAQAAGSESGFGSCPPCGLYEHCYSYTNYECVCASGFTGFAGNCTDIDECLDGNICDHLGENSTCNNTIGYYECGCEAGFYKNFATYQCEPIEGVILFEPRIINHRVGCNPDDTAYERHYISYEISHTIQSYQRVLESESGADSGSGNGN